MAENEDPKELTETVAGGEAVAKEGEPAAADAGAGAGAVAEMGSPGDMGSASAGGFGNSDGDGDGEKEEEEVEEEADHELEHELAGIASNEVKNIILQVLSPYFEDDGSDGGDEEDTAQRYDHLKCKSWIQLICDGIQERLLGLGKPYKYVTHCMIMRKCGAGMHVCSSCYYGAADGWVSHAHDLSAHIYAVVTVYWCAI